MGPLLKLFIQQIASHNEAALCLSNACFRKNFIRHNVQFRAAIVALQP